MCHSMTFYGTGGAEAVPSPFCRCSLCENARSAGGKDRRRRSMFRLNEKICLDFGPDAVCQAMEFGHFAGLEHVLITHTHEDHFYYALAETRALAAPPPPGPLNYYLTGKAFEVLDYYRKTPAVMGGKFEQLEERGIVAFHRLEFGTTYSVAGASVTPLPGNHRGNLEEPSANYLIGLADGKSLYYGVDTGHYLPETMAALKGRGLDILISECTYGNAVDRGEQPGSHLDLGSCLHLFRQLLAQGAIHAATRIYLTHINHKHTATHAEMERLVQEMDVPCQITVAYDGCRIL